MISDTIDRILPLNLKFFYKELLETEVFGNYGHFLNGCICPGLDFVDADENNQTAFLSLSQDVFVEKAEPVWLSSTVMKLPTVSTQEFALVFKDDVLLSDDLWNWVDGSRIELTAPKVPDSVYKVSYDQDIYCESSVIDVGVFSSSYDIHLAGYLFQMMASYREPEVTIEEELIFKPDFTAEIQYLPVDNKSGTLVSKEKIIVIDWSYASEKVIKIGTKEYDPRPFIFTYKTKQLLCSFAPYTLYHRYSQTGDIWTEYEQTYFGAIVYPARYHQIKLQFHHGCRANMFRLKSLVLVKVKNN